MFGDAIVDVMGQFAPHIPEFSAPFAGTVVNVVACRLTAESTIPLSAVVPGKGSDGVMAMPEVNHFIIGLPQASAFERGIDGEIAKEPPKLHNQAWRAALSAQRR